MSHTVTPWRSFSTLDSNNEASFASACCRFSFATLEVARCCPGIASFALTEKQQFDAWRWAICNHQGSVMHAGSECTQTAAKRAAEDALLLEEI